jgi:hypothetical protein
MSIDAKQQASGIGGSKTFELIDDSPDFCHHGCLIRVTLAIEAG